MEHPILGLHLDIAGVAFGDSEFAKNQIRHILWCQFIALI